MRIKGEKVWLALALFATFTAIIAADSYLSEGTLEIMDRTLVFILLAVFGFVLLLYPVGLVIYIKEIFFKPKD